MYCSSCGTAVSPKLSFCNRCGAELNAKERSAIKPSETLPESLVWAIVSVSVGGLAILIGLMAVMKQVLRFNDGLITALTLLSFLILIGAESVFIWLLLRSQKSAKETGSLTQPKELATKELAETQARALNEVAPSITEHTTRTLEPAHHERNAQ
jgi:uncharacterized paraquat-inducible protein A